jgi:hypothetical protein
VEDASGCVQREGKIGSTRGELDTWVRTLPQPRTIAVEATIFTGWIYDHLLPHASAIKVAHPLMQRAIAAAKKKNDKIDASKIADCLRCDFLRECLMASTEIRDRRTTKPDITHCALSRARSGHLCLPLTIDSHGGRQYGMYGPPLCRKRKVKMTVWSAQMYPVFD